jgi:chaperonin cofactor prefoldin
LSAFKELKLLDEDANVFKLIGPALVKQDLVEAKSNVTKRLEYIQAEIDRIETNIKAIELKQTEKQQEVHCVVYNAMCMPARRLTFITLQVLKLQQKLQSMQASQQQIQG